jgi:hypothetical protein
LRNTNIYKYISNICKIQQRKSRSIVLLHCTLPVVPSLQFNCMHSDTSSSMNMLCHSSTASSSMVAQWHFRIMPPSWKTQQNIHKGIGCSKFANCALPAYQLPILMDDRGKLLVPTDTQLSNKDKQKIQTTYQHDLLLCNQIYDPTTLLMTTHPQDLLVFGDVHKQPAEVPVDGVWRCRLISE